MDTLPDLEKAIAPSHQQHQNQRSSSQTTENVNPMKVNDTGQLLCKILKTTVNDIALYLKNTFNNTCKAEPVKKTG